jgi:hypothetical protein
MLGRTTSAPPDGAPVEEATMPALRLREVQMPELHLPEMSRDDIARVIGDARRDVDLRRLDPRQLDVPEIELPKVDLPTVDIPKAISNAIEATGIGRSRRPRLPFVIGGLITLGLVGFALLTSPMVRPRLTDLGQKVKERIDARRRGDSPSDEPRAFDAAVAVPIQPAAFAADGPVDGTPFDGPSDLPAGLGAEPMTAEEPARS